MTAKRVTKKQQYLNSQNFDLEYYRTEIAAGKNFVWHLGDRISSYQVKKRIHEIEADLLRIAAEPTYKPWTEFEF